MRDSDYDEQSGGTGKFLIFLASAVLIGGLLAAGIGFGLSKLIPVSATAAVDCPTDKIKPATIESVSVNVYNATQSSGLAAKTAAQLKTEGLTIGIIGNKTANQTRGKVPAKFAEKPQILIAVSKDNLAAAAAVQRYFPQSAVLVSSDKASTVDVFLQVEQPTMETGKNTESVQLNCQK